MSPDLRTSAAVPPPSAGTTTESYDPVRFELAFPVVSVDHNELKQRSLEGYRLFEVFAHELPQLRTAGDPPGSLTAPSAFSPALGRPWSVIASGFNECCGVSLCSRSADSARAARQ